MSQSRLRLDPYGGRVADELADVVVTALVAIESLGFDARAVLDECAVKVSGRLSEHAGLGQ